MSLEAARLREAAGADLAACLGDVVRRALSGRGIEVASLEAGPAVSADPAGVLAGVRVVTFAAGALDAVGRAVGEELEVVERDEGEERPEADLGARGARYLVRLRPDGPDVAERPGCAGLVGEVQVRTVLQEAWAAIERELRRRAPDGLPRATRRRLAALAGALDVAERELQAIVDAGPGPPAAGGARPEAVDELTPEALRAYLDRRLGPDPKALPVDYARWVAVLRGLGFTGLGEVDDLVGELDDRQIGRHVWDSPQGQLSRFELLLLAAMGERFIERHPWRHVDWFVALRREWLRRLRDAGAAP